jgi:arabinogalactan endo-1,4-beta-galactosidase
VRIAWIAVLLLLCASPARGERAFVVGADLSSLAQVRAAGGVFRDGGAPQEPYELFRTAGCGMVRLRLWHSPATPWNGLDSTLAAAAHARDAGLPWMLDLHYSDTWADPGQQAKPAAWAALSASALQDSVYAYTRAVLHDCVAAGVTPAAVQLGNEINAGLFWDTGRVGWSGGAWDTPAQWSQCVALLSAASRAVSDEFPGAGRPEVLLHLATAGDSAGTRWFLDHVTAGGVPFDAVAFSYYPWWHGGLPAAAQNLHAVANRYGKRVWIVETSYPWTLAGADTTGNFVTSTSQLLAGYLATPSGQLQFLQDLVALERGLPGGLGAGVLVWGPEMLPVAGGPTDPCENLTLFDFAGNALPGLRFGAPRASSSHATVAVVGDFNAWTVAAPSMTQVSPCVWTDTLAVTAGCWLFKFVTDGAWDTPLDYGSCDGEHAGCTAGTSGTSCLASGTGTAIGRVPFATSGAYLFRLDERDGSWAIEPLSVADAGYVPRAGALSVTATPRPFARALTVRFAIPAAAHVRLGVYDLFGRLVRRLADGDLPASERSVVWDGAAVDGRAVPAGVYVVRLQAGAATAEQRVVRVR